MKQIRFKHLATLGVCCSLFSNSLAGVTAVAETMTIESRPTAESTQVEEEEKTEETETQESLLKTAEQKEMSNSLIGSSRAIANFAFPERVAKFQFVDENGNLLNPSLFELTSDFALRTNGSLYNPVHYAGTDVGTTKQIIFPQTSIVTENSPSNPVFVGATDSQVVIPRFAESISVVPPTNYTGNTYVQPNVEQYNRSGSNWVLNATYTTEKLNVHKKDASTYGIGAAPPFLGLLPIESNASRLYYVAATSTTSYLNRLFSVSGVTTLYVTNRKVTEFFKNQAGATIPTPPNFEEGRKTSITNNNYTFKQSGTLPDTYTSGGKTYKFKGWYKGKTKPATLETSKTPSYAVTYDDNDDLNVVYEEIEAFDFPAITYQFGFLDESGKRVDASTIGMTYDNWYGEVLGTNVADWKTINIEKGQVAPTKNNLKEIVYPAQSLEIMSGRNSQYSAANLTFALPKYYEKMSVYNKNGTFDAAYPIPSVQNNNSTNPIVEGTDKTVSKWFELKKSGSQSFILNQTITAASTDVQVPGYLREVVHNPTTTATKGTYYTLDKPVYYYLTNRKVTENFVDASGAKITPPTGFTQGKQTVIDSDPYTFKQSGTLPDTYKAGGKTYKFKGWYKGKTKPATLETTKTPSYAVTYDDKDDMTAVYEEVQPTAEMTVSRLLEVIPNEASMVWTVRLKNTSEVPLTNVKLAPTAKWAAGISAPTQLAVRISNTPNKIIPVTAEQWRTGVNLGVEIPVNGEALVTVNTAKITGEPRQLLTAEMTASNFVRIQGEDQTITPTPTEEGFISTPTFDFGKITISSSVKQYGLKKAADYYGNGTRNPYLRIKKSQPNWQLTAQLSQLKASTDSLPTSTRLLLGNANVAAIENYNQVTELTNKVGVTKALTLTSDGTSTPVILNNQFTGNDVYQLDFDFASVKLEVPANQGKINEKYQGTVTWNLVTGP
ncbi:WxL domain-containing protein [Enterococcus faecalis]|nr:WxL domain-containing protein [Enterococcus faecalis]EKZ0109324.1 WxL domain-containing protein [Enterococcus faecalis]